MQQCAPVILRHLCGGDVEVEGAGDAREGRGAGYFHIFSVVDVEVDVKNYLYLYGLSTKVIFKSIPKIIHIIRIIPPKIPTS